MTMPHLMNCPHADEGWCLECVRKLYETAARLRDQMLQIEQVAHNPADLAPDLLFAELGVSGKEALWLLVDRLGAMANDAYHEAGGLIGDDPNSCLAAEVRRLRAENAKLVAAATRHEEFIVRAAERLVESGEDHEAGEVQP